MKAEEFKIDYIQHYLESGGSFTFSSQGESFPYRYLEFARTDLEEDSPRCRVNAVGNAKRALHLQVETIYDAFGWSSVHGKKNLNFVKRLEYLRACGVISPTILSKINRTRNRVEHDYYIPKSEEAYDYVDIVELFVAATKNFVDRFPDHMYFDLMQDEEVGVTLPKILSIALTCQEGGLKITLGPDYTKKGKAKPSFRKEIAGDDYFDWLRAVIEQFYL